MAVECPVLELMAVVLEKASELDNVDVALLVEGQGTLDGADSVDRATDDGTEPLGADPWARLDSEVTGMDAGGMLESTVEVKTAVDKQSVTVTVVVTVIIVAEQSTENDCQSHCTHQHISVELLLNVAGHGSGRGSKSSVPSDQRGWTLSSV